MDFPEIEDTDHWLGSPTELETVMDWARMLDNEIHEMTLQLRTARQNIFKLVEANAELAKKASAAEAALHQVRTQLSEAYREVTEVTNKANGTAFTTDRQIRGLLDEISRYKRAAGDTSVMYPHGG